jgi:hypothetical protein
MYLSQAGGMFTCLRHKSMCTWYLWENTFLILDSIRIRNRIWSQTSGSGPKHPDKDPTKKARIRLRIRNTAISAIQGKFLIKK